jgi:hypothetical protein
MKINSVKYKKKKHKEDIFKTLETLVLFYLGK